MAVVVVVVVKVVLRVPVSSFKYIPILSGDVKEITKLKSELSKVKRELAERDRQLSNMVDAKNKAVASSLQVS